MDFSKKVSWEQGLFLQPQHLQVSDLHRDAVIAKLIKLTADNFWGCDMLSLDSDSLQDNKVSISSGTIVFRDGAIVEIGVNAQAVARSFSETWGNKSRDLDVYIGLKKLDKNGNNVTTVKSEIDAVGVKTRFVALEQPKQVKDIYSKGPDAYVKTQQYALNIIFGYEVEESANYELVQIARVRQNGGKNFIDTKFISPSLNITSSRSLYEIVQSIRDSLHTRARQLEIYKSTSAVEDIALQNRRWMNLLALQVFNRYMPALTQVLNISPKSTSDAFGLLLQVIGELKTFSHETVISGVDLNSPEPIMYNHHNPFESFELARNVIFTLCDAVTLTPSQFYELQYVNGIFAVDLPVNIFTPRTSYYLRIHTENNDIKDIQAKVIDKQIKVGALTSINMIVERSLGGVSYEMLDGAPSGVPSDIDCVYIRLDSTAAAWRNIVSSQSMSIFCNELKENIKIDFVCVRS